MKTTPKFAFTPSGVADMNTYLYGLPEAERWMEIQEVQEDFKAWMQKMFFLDAEQLTWMDSRSSTFIFVVSNQLAVTMSLGLPIRMVIEGNAKLRGVKRGKSHNPITSNATGEGEEPEAEGEFVYTVTY